MTKTKVVVVVVLVDFESNCFVHMFAMSMASEATEEEAEAVGDL